MYRACVGVGVSASMFSRKRKRSLSSSSPYALRTKSTRPAPIEDDHTVSHIQTVDSCDDGMSCNVHIPTPEKHPKISSNDISVVHKPVGSHLSLSSTDNHETSMDVATGSQGALTESITHSVSSGSKPLCSCCKSPPVGTSMEVATIEDSFVCEGAAMCGNTSVCDIEVTTPLLLKDPLAIRTREHEPEVVSKRCTEKSLVMTTNVSSFESGRDKVTSAVRSAVDSIKDVAADKDPILPHNQLQAEGDSNNPPPALPLNLGDSWSDEVCLDELFSLGPSFSSKIGAEEEEDLLRGICPEDLSMSFNISCYFDTSCSRGGSSDAPRTPKLEHSVQQKVTRTPKAAELSAHSHSTPVRTSTRYRPPNSPNSIPVADACIPASTGGALRTGNVQARDSSDYCSAKPSANNEKSPGTTAQTKDSSSHPKGDHGSFAKHPQNKLEFTATGTEASRQLLSYPKGTFYGLPMEVLACLEEHRGIKKLYGRCEVAAPIPSSLLSCYVQVHP